MSIKDFVDLKFNLALKSKKGHNLLKSVFAKNKLLPLLMSGGTFQT